MAIVFELVVNFGDDDIAARAAHRRVVGAPPLVAGGRDVRLHEPLLGRARGLDGSPYLLMSVIPVGVGWGVALDQEHEPVRLSAPQLTGLGHQLYRLLAGFTGYRAARVGWDPEAFTDPAELRQEWADELRSGALPGLVLAEDVLPGMRGAAFTPFTTGFVWLPYTGEQESALTWGSAG
ncbi:hypothetical protein [Micromonospora auratinigra]|uniref:Uncharacterized protein n=1 Tax=Micromonospora auratinigra TaxID=261654 RepID=A0A1A8ZHT1_9ACTN|nr:hypothetical protein [Micromonospora auratinigra]SBT43587.1 hypothetical protein GA0070611_2376 [Micromonospora auratinigra]